jgi:hypothetical protein
MTRSVRRQAVSATLAGFPAARRRWEKAATTGVERPAAAVAMERTARPPARPPDGAAAPQGPAVVVQGRHADQGGDGVPAALPELGPAPLGRRGLARLAAQAGLAVVGWPLLASGSQVPVALAGDEWCDTDPAVIDRTVTPPDAVLFHFARATPSPYGQVAAGMAVLSPEARTVNGQNRLTGSIQVPAALPGGQQWKVYVHSFDDGHADYGSPAVPFMTGSGPGTFPFGVAW